MIFNFCPTCGNRPGKWDTFFQRLKSGAQLHVSIEEAKNIHALASKRGIRVQIHKKRGEVRTSVKLMGYRQ